MSHLFTIYLMKNLGLLFECHDKVELKILDNIKFSQWLENLLNFLFGSKQAPMILFKYL